MGRQKQRQKANKQIHRVGVWGQQLGQFINLVSISFSETTYSCVNLLVDHSLPAECFHALGPWSCSMLEAVPCCPACTQHLHPLRACSHLKVLSPTSSHALVHEDRWGDCDSAPFCCCIVFFFPWSENWGNTSPSPASSLQEEKENYFSLPNPGVPQRHRCEADATHGTWRAGRGSGAGQRPR